MITMSKNKKHYGCVIVHISKVKSLRHVSFVKRIDNVNALLVSLYLCLLAYSGVQRILCCVFCFGCLRLVSYVPKCCQFLWLSILPFYLTIISPIVFIIIYVHFVLLSYSQRVRRGCNIVGITTTYAISAYHH